MLLCLMGSTLAKMKIVFIALLPFCFFNCCQSDQNKSASVLKPENKYIPVRSYGQIKDSIAINRKRLSLKYASFTSLTTKESIDEISDYWVNIVSNDLYSKWQNTPWDFNGTTVEPNQGAIACGYFVTTILRDMDLKISRNKLAICPSSIMMKSLTPHQKIKNLSHLSYPAFEETLSVFGKGVYIIGLDFHTGFIINDGSENWFIHSNYINRKGVMKERVSGSYALRSSKTRWIISLTNDKDFLYRWLKG